MKEKELQARKKEQINIQKKRENRSKRGKRIERKRQRSTKTEIWKKKQTDAR